MGKIDDVIDPINLLGDVLELAGSVKTLKKTWEILTELRLVYVFKNCSKQLEGDGEIEEKFRTKFDGFLKHEFGRNTIYSLTNKALNADNALTCKILGVLLGKVMNENRKPTFKESIIIEALESLRDTEILLLKELFTKMSLIPYFKERYVELQDNLDEYSEYINRNSFHISDYYENSLIDKDYDEIYLSIERLKRFQILGSTMVHDNIAVITTDGLFQFTSLSIELINLADKVE
jgi:hypothetical protein